MKPHYIVYLLKMAKRKFHLKQADTSGKSWRELSFRSYVKCATSAGYPSGALGNAAPKEFAQLHTLILKLGKGNAKRGIKKVMSFVEDKL